MNLTGLLAFVFILGAAVVLHEFGHFIVAKLLRIRVETFSVGFGKRLWGRRWGTTDYRLSLIPLGGYVKLGGDESNAGIEEGGAEEIPAQERFDRARAGRRFWWRGRPVMNILTAWPSLRHGARQRHPASPSPSSLVEPGGAAEVRACGGRPLASFTPREPSWRFLNGEAGQLRPEMPLVVDRDGRASNSRSSDGARADIGGKYGELDLQPDLARGRDRRRGQAGHARRRGRAPAGDHNRDDGDEKPAARADQQYTAGTRRTPRIVVNRDGERVELTTPERRAEGKTLGFLFAQPPLEPVGVAAAASHAVEVNVEVLRLTGVALGQVFTGQRGIGETLSGPIEIAQVSNEAAKNFGWEGVFNILSFLSLNLGIFNLLPIPVLDGGMIFMLLVEGLLALVGVKLSMTVRERIQQVGFVFLLLLMGFVIINDVTKVA